MANSSNAGYYFQTSDSLATTERKAKKAKNKYGDPIRLPSKILAVENDPFDDGAVYVAEAAGEVKRIVLETNKIQKTSIQANAPLTSLAISSNTQTLFAGCWNQQIYSTTIQSGTKAPSASPYSTQRLARGHTDFIKCLLTTTLNNQPILLSGAADSAIIVWNLQTSQPLHKLNPPTKALQDLAIDPLGLREDAQDSFILFTASSDREIRRWRIGVDSAYELPESLENPILAHETSVYKLRFDADGDLWTASADKTARHLVRSRGWEADTTLSHPDFVRDVVVSERAGLVVTACRDEEVRVWDASSGDLVCTYSGHFEEVTGLALVEGGRKVVSVSIDGTVRKWSLERKEMARYLEEVKREEESGDAAEDKQVQVKGSGSMLTAEEEAELAELMEDEDDNE